MSKRSYSTRREAKLLKMNQSTLNIIHFTINHSTLIFSILFQISLLFPTLVPPPLHQTLHIDSNNLLYHHVFHQKSTNIYRKKNKHKVVNLIINKPIKPTSYCFFSISLRNRLLCRTSSFASRIFLEWHDQQNIVCHVHKRQKQCSVYTKNLFGINFKMNRLSHAEPTQAQTHNVLNTNRL